MSTWFELRTWSKEFPIEETIWYSLHVEVAYEKEKICFKKNLNVFQYFLNN